MLPPLSAAGYEFVVHPIPAKPGARTYYRILPTEAGTTYTFEGGVAVPGCTGTYG